MLVCHLHPAQELPCPACRAWNLEGALRVIAKGYCDGQNRNMECKTVGNMNDALYGPGNHCLVCWANEVQRLAQESLKK